jgi:SAM-dependent methyltransferase
LLEGMSLTMQLHWPAPERNKVPILAVLERVLPREGLLLEVSSGSGQHAVHFARALPAWTWLPSDIDPRNLASIAAYVAEAELPNLMQPRNLDVCTEDWQLGELDALFNANMIHIAPWACCEGLLRGAGRYLRAGGVLVMYGPFRIGGAHTAESNREFDLDLRRRNPSWGVRDLESVATLAQAAGLSLRETVAMPANNLCLVFERDART